MFFILIANILANQFGLVEFEDEECTAVVPFQCFFSILVDLAAMPIWRHDKSAMEQ